MNSTDRERIRDQRDLFHDRLRKVRKVRFLDTYIAETRGTSKVPDAFSYHRYGRLSRIFRTEPPGIYACSFSHHG